MSTSHNQTCCCSTKRREFQRLTGGDRSYQLIRKREGINLVRLRASEVAIMRFALIGPQLPILFVHRCWQCYNFSAEHVTT